MKHRKSKRILSALLTMAMCVTLFPAGAFAENVTANALPEAKNGVITLTGDVTLSEATTLSDDVTIDLAGHTITTSMGLVVTGDVTVKDSTASTAPQVNDKYEVTYTSGKIDYTGKNTGITIKEGGSLTVESGTIESGGVAAYAIGDCKASDRTEVKSTVNMEGGYIQAQEFGIGVQGLGATANVNGGVIATKDNAVVAGNGTVSTNQNLGGTTINITGGTMIGHITAEGYIACGVYHPQAGQLNISGGTIYADSGLGVLMRAGDANITGGDIIATGNVSGKVGDAKTMVGSYGVVYDEESNYPGLEDDDIVTISGDASVGGEVGAVATVPVENTTTDRFTISGGTFSSDVSSFVAENYKCEQVDGSSYQVQAMESELVVKPSTGDDNKVSATLEGQYAGADTTIEGGVEDDESAVTNEGVTIDLTTDSTSSTTSAALTVTAETAKSLATNKAPSLSVKTDLGTVALNQTAVAKMGEVTEPVVVSVEKTTPDPSAENIAAEYTISVTSNGKNLLPDGADNGTVTITVPVSEKNLQPWCVVDSNGTTIYAEKLPVVASTEDSLTFTIGHLSKIQLLKADPESGTAIASITKKDGTKTYYSDVNALQTAVSSAIAGDVIDLLDDVTATSAVNSGTITAVFHVNEGVTINGNGHTLAYSGTGVINHIINVNKSADAAAINDLVIDATNAKYGVQFYCTNGGSLNNVTINNGTYAAVNINGAQNVTITDSTLNPGESAYANIDYSMGKNVTTIPSIALDNVSMKNGIYQVWADETTITNMKTQMGNNPSNEEVLENVKDNIDYTSPSGGSLQITVNFGSEAGGTVTDRVDSSYQPPYTGDHNYAVTVARTQGGSVSIDKADQYANAGETITFTVTPDKGYSIDKVTVTQGSKAIDVTDNSDSTYSFTMPKGPVTITVTFTESDQPEPTPELPFTDVHEDDWYYQSVLYVYNEGLMTGTAADTFSPGITTTRGMIVSILYRQEGEPAVTTDAGFADVVDGAYYEDAVNWAAEEGIVNGYSDTAFGPNDAITREQMAAILMNYAEYKGQDVSARADLSGYTDADTVSGWASDAVQWANAEGLINGMSDTELAPKGHATRAQVAAILQRFLAE